jgi:Zn-dependent peptidase ImmA (M78 family)
MGYTIEDAALKIGVKPDRYEDWELGKKLPTYKQLEDLAEKVYKRPLAVLLMNSPLQEDSIQKDFRNLSNAEVSNLSADVRIAIRKARRYQLILEEVASDSRPPKFLDFQVSKNDSPNATAIRFRQFLQFPLSDQKSWKYEDAFKNFRTLVESIGIYVFLMKLPMVQARAFCLAGKFPIIVLSQEDSRNGRIFSLFHELCHILFNQGDIFRDSSTGQLNKEYKDIESFCNQFAASFLVPEESFVEDMRALAITNNNISEGKIQKLAQVYKISNEVIARKFLALGVLREDKFWKLKRLWDLATISAKERQKEEMKGEDFKGINQGIKILNEKGKLYVSNVIHAYQQNLISSADASDYLETKISHVGKIIDRLSK